MPRHWIGRWLAGCSWLLAGCLTAYAPPDANAPSAALILDRDPNVEVNTFLAYPDDACTSGPGAGLLGNVGVLRSDTMEVRVATDTRLFIKAGSYRSTYRSQTLEQKYCVNLVSFVPQPGRRYRVQQMTSTSTCSTVVVDVATEQPPPDFVRHVLKEPCRIR